MQTAKKIISLLLVSGLLTITVGACASYTFKDKSARYSKGPPPWAPAHGLKSKHKYRYYPSSSVYFDMKRAVYFYRTGDVWIESHKLPLTIYLNVDNYVILAMDADKPYKYHKKVAERYPHGLDKKKSKRKVKHKKYYERK